MSCYCKYCKKFGYGRKRIHIAIHYCFVVPLDQLSMCAGDQSSKPALRPDSCYRHRWISHALAKMIHESSSLWQSHRMFATNPDCKNWKCITHWNSLSILVHSCYYPNLRSCLIRPRPSAWIPIPRPCRGWGAPRTESSGGLGLAKGSWGSVGTGGF